MTHNKSRSTRQNLANKAAAIPPKNEVVDRKLDDLFLEDAGLGQDNMDREDFAVPRIAILQALSPQTQKQKSEFIPGAEVGDIIDTVSFSISKGDVGVLVVPVSYRRAYIEWKLRTDGGGFVKDHGSDGAILNSCKKDEQGRDITKEGNQIVTTAEYFVFVVDPNGTHNPAVISMAATQLKKARRWNTIINQFRLPKKDGGTFNPPMFARSYLLTTHPEQNDKGTWFGWNILPAKVLSEVNNGSEIYSSAKTLQARVMAGEVKASPQTEDVAGAAETDDDPM